MQIDWDVPIAMGDCLVLRSDVCRPVKAASWGAQGLHTRDNFEGFVRAASA